MNQKFDELAKTLVWFAEDMWLPFEDSLSIISRRINDNLISREALKSQFSEAINDESFDWVNASKESQLLIEPEAYSNIETKNYVQCLLQDYLFPEKILSNERIELLNSAVQNILKEYVLNDGWMYSYDLFEALKKEEPFKDLENFNLWKISFLIVQRKPILCFQFENKDREIGYLRYKKEPLSGLKSTQKNSQGSRKDYMNFDNLLRALNEFMESLWRPFEDSIGGVNAEIERGMINKKKLIQEFSEAINDENFDWVNFSKESQLLIEPESYSNIEIKNYVQRLLQDYLYPEKILSNEKTELLNGTVQNILKEYVPNYGWMYSYDLFEALKKEEPFKDLEYYNLWKLSLYSIVKRKSIENKGSEIGYLRYKESAG